MKEVQKHRHLPQSRVAGLLVSIGTSRRSVAIGTKRLDDDPVLV